MTLSDTVVTLLSAKTNMSADDMFEPLIDAFNHRKSNYLSQSHLGGIASKFRFQSLGFEKLKDYMNAAVDAGIIRLFGKETFHVPGFVGAARTIARYRFRTSEKEGSIFLDAKAKSVILMGVMEELCDDGA
ncbi:hypothetical protein HDU77_011756 [Chytriomyces hyalinus]|nr:hypothetical protein HDU77_011756 [Chytriomyces hyalinus]